MQNELTVDLRSGMTFDIHARQHSMVIDLVNEKGGEDLGINPPEAFIASLGACVGVYVGKYCQNAKLDAKGLKISLTWEFSDDKTRISDIDIKISLPNTDVGKRAKAILEVAHHCLIHNTILTAPAINISLNQ